LTREVHLLIVFPMTVGPARQLPFFIALAVVGLVGAYAHAEMLSGRPLVDALKKGGYVLIMRHASSPTERPTKATADPGNDQLERQLDQSGKAAAEAMGKAIRTLHIPLVDAISSPTFRARETARLAGLSKTMTFRELGAGAKGMHAKIGEKQARWLRERAEELPPKGTDTLVITHTPNIKAAFGEKAKGIASGEALVFKPDGKGQTMLVARIAIDDWPALAALK
jgi:phosphohistidine phosphatase SixA